METRPVYDQILATIMLTVKPKMITLLPIFTFTGVAMTMWASWFPRQMDATAVGVIMPFFGLAELIGGFTIGPFIDAFGRSIGLVSHCRAIANLHVTVYHIISYSIYKCTDEANLPSVRKPTNTLCGLAVWVEVVLLVVKDLA